MQKAWWRASDHAMCAELGLPLTGVDCSESLGYGMEYESADPDNYTYHPEVAGDCLATARQFYDPNDCARAHTPADIDMSVLDVCDGVFQGKIEPGDPCTVGLECALAPGDQAECRELHWEIEETVCLINRRVAEGDPCYKTCTDEPGGWSCFGHLDLGPEETPAIQGMCFTNDGLFCAGGTCERAPTIGEPCGGDLYCAKGYCSVDTGECSTARNEGAYCEDDSECGGGLHCDSQYCAPKRGVGDACDFDSECESSYCSAEYACADGSDVNVEVAFTCSIASDQE